MRGLRATIKPEGVRLGEGLLAQGDSDPARETKLRDVKLQQSQKERIEVQGKKQRTDLETGIMILYIMYVQKKREEISKSVPYDNPTQSERARKPRYYYQARGFAQTLRCSSQSFL